MNTKIQRKFKISLSQVTNMKRVGSWIFSFNIDKLVHFWKESSYNFENRRFYNYWTQWVYPYLPYLVVHVVVGRDGGVDDAGVGSPGRVGAGVITQVVNSLKLYQYLFLAILFV